MIQSFHSCTTLEASNSLLWGKAKALYDSQQHLPYLSYDNQKCLWTLLEARRNIRLCFHNFIPSLEYNYYSLERRPVMSGLSLHITHLSMSLHLDTLLLPKPSHFKPNHHPLLLTTAAFVFISVSHVRDYRKHYVWITSVSHYSGTEVAIIILILQMKKLRWGKKSNPAPSKWQTGVQICILWYIICLLTIWFYFIFSSNADVSSYLPFKVRAFR